MTNATLFCGNLEPTRMRWKDDQVHTTTQRQWKQLCRSVTMSSLSAVQHVDTHIHTHSRRQSLSLKQKNPVKARVAFILHVLTNALDHGVQILADVFNACSDEPQSPLNVWSGRSLVFSLGTWPSKPTDSETPSIKAESLSICCTIC